MLSYLANYSDLYGPLRLFEFRTVRAVLAVLTALGIGFAIGPLLIRRFRELKFGRVNSAPPISTKSTRPPWAA